MIETQVVIDQNESMYIWRRPDEIWLPEFLGVRGRNQCSAMFWGCITHEGVGTFTEVDGNINSQKYINILDTHLWASDCSSFSK